MERGEARVIPIAGAYVHLRHNFPTSEYQIIGEKLFDYLLYLQDSFLPGVEKGIEVRLEEGSTKIWATFLVLLEVLTHYGDLRQSVDYVVKDSVMVSEKVVTHLKESWDLSGTGVIYQRKEMGVAAQLQDLFQKVDRNEIASEKATDKAVAILRKYASSDDDLEIELIAKELRKEFEASAKKRTGTSLTSRSGKKLAERTDEYEVIRAPVLRPSTPATPMECHVLTRKKGLIIRKKPHQSVPEFEFF